MQPHATTTPEQIGGYRILSVLGAGAQGQVFEAESDTGTRVAIKQLTLLPGGFQSHERFEREVDNLKSVNGLHIARYIDADVSRDAEPKWLATEFVDGPDLDGLIADTGALSAVQSALMGAQIAEGLKYVHSYSMLHRDLKPQNIVIGSDGPKIIDFGLSILAERRGELTSELNTVGTANWLPPEQFRTSSVTPSADIYALGLIIAFAVTNRRPFKGIHELHGVESVLAGILTDMLDEDYNRRPDAAEANKRLLSYATRNSTLHAVKRAQERDILPPPRRRESSAERSITSQDVPAPLEPVATSKPKPRATPSEPSRTRREPSRDRAATQAKHLRENYAASTKL